ncbi:MAG: helix-turn-helix domain-containing protein [Streptosporangiaceae bacterium]
MAGPEHSQYEREKLSRLLLGLRERAGLSGREASRRAGFSQSKLSKVENGMLLPSFADAEAICAATGAPDHQRDEILDLLKELHSELESARVILRRGAYRKQRQIAQIEAGTRLQRAFDLGMVIGLLQTPEYMRQVFSRRLNAQDQERAVAARVHRQEVLRDPAKRFTFVMTEGALRWRIGSRELMAAQMEHIAEVSRLPNVRVGVIPWSTEAHVFPGHEFHIYDERWVIIGIETATATVEDPRDVAVYIQLFEELDRLATFGEACQRLLRQIASEYQALPR